MSESTELYLTQGYKTLIDTKDLPLVSKHSWCVQQYKDKTRHGGSKIYAKASIAGTQITLHRFLLNPPKGAQVDHINGNPLDNRRCNLRLVTKQQNAANRPKDRIKTATSKYKGVYWLKKNLKWCSRIHVNGKGIHLGVFIDEIEAAKTYDAAALKYFGEFACLNLSA